MTRALGAAALGIALGLAGATFDLASLYVPALGLVVLAVGAVLWVRLAASGARVERAPGPARVVEEEPWPLRLRIRAGLLPPPGGELFEPLMGWPVPIAGRWSRRVRINVRFSRRGRRRLEPALLRVSDPLRLHTREVVGDPGEEVLVLPRVEPVLSAAHGGQGAARGLAGGGSGGTAGGRLPGAEAELDLDGLRPYRPGAPASRIHWPAVARTGEMLERRLVSELDSAPLVALDAVRPAGEEELDMAVRAAASLVLHLARTGACALLLPGDRRPSLIGADLAAWSAAHARLAVVEAGGRPPGLGRAVRSGAVLWVTAARTNDAPATLARVAAPARYVVSPLPLPGLPVLFTVAGCSGQRVGRALRRSARAEEAA